MPIFRFGADGRYFTRLATAVFFYGAAFVSLCGPLAIAANFEGIPAEQISEIVVQTEDGVHEKLIHLRNPGKPILLMEPGLGAQGMSLEFTATQLWKRGQFDIFIGNWRGSAQLPRGQGLRPLGERNGLEQVLRKDFPAHLRHVLQYASPEQKAFGVSLLGHSMGGMMITSSLSDPLLAAEFKPHIRSIVLFQSPHHIQELLGHMKALARIGLPALKALKAAGIETIDLHSKLFGESRLAKTQGGPVARALVRAAESFTIAVLKLALSPAHTDNHKIRHVLYKFPAYAMPVDLMIDFAHAAVRDGQFRDVSGRLLIRPEAISDLPIQVVRTRLDTLAPWRGQAELYRALATPRKQLLSVHEMNHIDSVLFTRPEVDFLDHVAAFLKDPMRQTETPREIVFRPKCESLLTQLRLKLRMRGI